MQRRADGTTAAEILGRQLSEYLVDHLRRQVLKQGRAAPVRHRALSRREGKQQLGASAPRLGGELELEAIGAWSGGERARSGSN